MFIIEISNQRSYYYIRLDDLNHLGFVWQKLSEKGYFKLHECFDFSSLSCCDFNPVNSFKDSDIYFDSLGEFLSRR